jgi:farnesol dehydrogenase
MTTLITGATGFVGGAIVRELVRRGNRVRVLVRPSSDRRALDGLDCEFAVGDVTDRASVEAAVKGCDRVFHAAALVVTWLRDRSAFDRVNVGGTRNVVEEALKAGVRRIVYTSTFLVLKPGEQPITEDTRARKEDTPTDYARSKRLAQNLVDRFVAEGAPIISVFPGVVFGPGRSTAGNLVGDWMVRFLRGEFPGYLGGGDRLWSFALADDVAVGHRLADEKGKTGRGYCLGGENVSIRNFMEKLAAMTGREPPTRCVPFSVARCVGLLQEVRAWLTGKPPELTRGIVHTFRHHWALDSARAKAELGYRPTPLQEGIERTLAWLRAEQLAE